MGTGALFSFFHCQCNRGFERLLKMLFCSILSYHISIIKTLPESYPIVFIRMRCVKSMSKHLAWIVKACEVNVCSVGFKRVC